MSVPKWLTLAAVLTGAAGLSAWQPPADPKPAPIDPVTVAAFARHKATYGRYDPALWWHADTTQAGTDLRGWTIRGQGLPAFFFGELPSTTDEELPRPAAPFAVVIQPTGVYTSQLTPPERTRRFLSLLTRLERMENLHALHIHRDQFGHDLDPEVVRQIGKLKQLRALRFHPPKGDALKPLAGLTRLRRLGLSLDGRGETDLRPLADLKELRWLRLDRFEHSDAGLAHLAGLPHLETLVIGGFRLKDGLKHLAGLKPLRHLELRSVRADDAGIAPLGELKQLHTLHLVWCKPREDWFAAVGRLGGLRRLVLENVHPADGEDPKRAPEWLRHLAGLKGLEVLEADSGSLLTDDSLQHLGGLKGLKELHLRRIRYGDVGVAHLAGLANLEVLDLPDNQALTGEGLKPLAELKKLRVVNLRGCDRITPAALGGLTAFPAVEHLDLGGFARRPLTDEHLEALAGLKTLKGLKLDQARGITDAGLKHLAGLDRLEDLDLSENRQLDGSGLTHLAGLKHLHTLRLAWCNSHGRPLDLAALPRLQGLRSLDLSGSPVDDDGLKAVAAVPGLKTLLMDASIRASRSPTAEGLKHLAGMRSLTTLEVVVPSDAADAAASAIANLTSLRSLAFQSSNRGPGPHPDHDAVFKHFAGLRELRTLVLAAYEVRDESVEPLRKLKQLETLILPYTKKISPAALAKLRDALPNTLIVIPG